MKYTELKKNQGDKVFLISLFCMYINNPFYISAIANINKIAYYCVSLSPIIYILIHGFIRLKRGVLNYIKYIIFYIFCAYAVTVVSGSHDMQYMYYFFRQLLGIIGMCAVYMSWLGLYKKNRVSVRLEEIYIISLLLYVLSTILFLAMPALKDYWFSIIMHYGNNETLINRQEYLTRIGVAGYSGFGNAFQIAMGLIYYTFMYINNRLSTKKRVLYLLILLAGCMFYGRIGTMIGAVILSFIAVYNLIIKKKIKFLLGAITSIIIIGVVMIGVYKYGSGSIKNFVDWAFEPVINYLADGKFSSTSTSALREFYRQFSPSKEILWHGVGYWLNEDGSYYGHKDVGFMRNIYYGGIIYTIITYGCVAYLVLSYFRLAKKYKHKGRGLISGLCILVFIAFEMKGDITFEFVKAFLPLYLGVYFTDDAVINLLGTFYTRRMKYD